MKKLLFILLCMLFSMSVQAQKVLGVEFGSTMEEVKSILKSRFGDLNTDEDYSFLNIHNLTLDDVNFEKTSFFFSYQERTDSKPRLTNISLRTNFPVNHESEAWEMYNKLKDILENKYGITEYEGQKAIEANMIGFGRSPGLIAVPLVFLNFLTTSNTEGVTIYSVTLDYYCGYGYSQLNWNL